MHQITPRQDKGNLITVKAVFARATGHPAKQGAGMHTDKRERRMGRRSKSQKAIRESGE